MWVEKYRPRTLSDIVNQIAIVSRLKIFIKERSMPHLIFSGPPGTGKTTCALALSHDLFGHSFRENVKELNASDERGIKVVRTSIKKFANYKGTGDAPFKILILDEADNMTSDAQQALRRTMESTSRNCRFILICNYSSKIIDPIQSRCSVFRFSPLKDEDILQRIKDISIKEKINLLEDGKEAILYNCGGDMRRAINILQTAATLKKEIDADTIYKVTGKARPEEIRNLLKSALNGDFLDAIQQVETLLNIYGLSGIDIIEQIHREIINLDNIRDLRKINLIAETGEINFRLIEGADEKIQLHALIAKIAKEAMERQ
ncbi:MAG: replication factor C small subunit [Candidatus Helarchaeota archaeon]